MSKSVLRAGIWYTISNFIVKGITFITMPIFTRIMSISDIGGFSNIISWFSILSIITTFELYSSVTIARFDYKKDLDSYISSTLFLGSLITFLFYVIVLIFNSFFQNIFSMDFETINVLFIYMLVYPAIQMFQVENRIKYNYKPIIIVSIGSSIISSVVSLLCVGLIENSLKSRVYGYYVPLIIMSILIYIFILYKGKSISRKYWKYSLTISFPLIWHLLAGNLLNSSDKVMISNMLGTEANALYSVAYSCSMIVSLLWTSMNSAWSPWAFEMMEQKKYELLKKNSKPYFIFFNSIVIIFMLFAPEILYFMGGSDYLSAVYVIPPVMVGYVYQFAYSLYINIEYYNKKQKFIALGTIIAATVNILLNYFWIPKFGYLSAAYSTLIGFILLFIIHFLIVKRLGYENWYDTKFLFCTLFIINIIGFFIIILYRFNTVRYLIILIIIGSMALLMIKMRKLLFNIIKENSLNPLRRFIKEGR